MRRVTSVFTFREPPEALPGNGEHGRHPRGSGGAVQRQQGLHAYTQLNRRPAQTTKPTPYQSRIPVRGASGGCRALVPYLRMRGGAASARRRDGRAAEEDADADLAGAARRREADERSSDLAAAAAIVEDSEMGFPFVFPPAVADTVILRDSIWAVYLGRVIWAGFLVSSFFFWGSLRSLGLFFASPSLPTPQRRRRRRRGAAARVLSRLRGGERRGRERSDLALSSFVASGLVSRRPAVSPDCVCGRDEGEGDIALHRRVHAGAQPGPAGASRPRFRFPLAASCCCL